jgi:hypothetical protein
MDTPLGFEIPVVKTLDEHENNEEGWTKLRKAVEISGNGEFRLLHGPGSRDIETLKLNLSCQVRNSPVFSRNGGYPFQLVHLLASKQRKRAQNAAPEG